MRRLESCYFVGASGNRYESLARVLTHSARTHCPDWDHRIVRLDPAPTAGGTGVAMHIANTYKLDAWCATIDGANHGDEVLLIDADTVILRPLDDVWREPFDIAYTTRDSALPFNLGVVFVRVSDITRAFFERWRSENQRLFQSSPAAAETRRRFGGVNQGAFGSLLERGDAAGVQLRALPCVEWNCEFTTWRSFDPALTRILHVNGTLRRQVFGEATVSSSLRPVVEAWRFQDRASRTRGSRTA